MNLVKDASVTYFEVYSGVPCYEWELLFERTTPDEQFLRFNMQTHSKKTREGFLGLCDIMRATSNLPADAVELPMPHFASFVPPFGFVNVAWTLEDIQKLILRTKKEQLMGMQVTAEFARQKAARGE